MESCFNCGKPLIFDEIALHKKLINRSADKFMCKVCCAKHFDVSTKLLDEKIEQYKKDGCTLFDETN